VSTAPGEVARRYLESFASHDPAVIAAHVADDFINEHASALGTGCVGRAEYLRRLPGFLDSLPGLRYEVEEVIAQGSGVAITYRLVATSDDRPVDVPGVMIIHVTGGLIQRRTDYWDALTFLRQVGRASAPGAETAAPRAT
jgi:ketosteroid isomerase-like protein